MSNEKKSKFFINSSTHQLITNHRRRSSVVEQSFHKREITGSIPVAGKLVDE